MLDLREEYRQRQGPGFNLLGFHNEVLRHGSPPIPLLREALLTAAAPHATPSPSDPR